MRAWIHPIFLLIFGFGSIVVCAGRASAGIVYQQNSQYPGQMQSAWSSSYDPISYANIYTTYDNFSLNQKATITTLTWQGWSFDENTLGSTATPITGFRIAFYANSSGVPGMMAFSQTIGFSEQAAGPIDQYGNGQIETVENYSGTLSGGFTAIAGTTYWISIQAVTDYPAIWTWASGTGGDGTSYQVVDTNSLGGSFVRPGDRALTLGTVPEPASFALCAIAAPIGLVFARFRTKAARLKKSSVDGISLAA